MSKREIFFNKLTQAEARWLSIEEEATQQDWFDLVDEIYSFVNCDCPTIDWKESDEVVRRMMRCAVRSIMFDPSYDRMFEISGYDLGDSLGENPIVSMLVEECSPHFVQAIQHLFTQRFSFYYSQMFFRVGDTANAKLDMNYFIQAKIISDMSKDFGFIYVHDHAEHFISKNADKHKRVAVIIDFGIWLGYEDFSMKELFQIDRMSEQVRTSCGFKNVHPGVLAFLHKP